MGKAVSKGLKYRAEVLLRELPDKYGKDFEKNKASLNELELGLSKTHRNILAGYIIRLAVRAESV
ncbi:MAG: 30S ribosomal protein S17e [Candidatus Diapherotrites archaeon]|mgnify:CR=1 FL=1|jgi:ribosomal protein S17E|uniref:30S ribosomal protein S17e n=1 Tax=Candidatus Iainarchaeum sp. TaxID=3101447 RepID=A0A8T5GFS5_9ARCH|nr:30S ribosomal protein S17e [Candidatus Diapherotrites archaeon]MBT7241342.1 30S ribosomal protein S17e [Candidatus Diapherotrites archaeon]